MKAVGIIPARYASTRFPGKPLAKIGNNPMVQWVYEAASKSLELDYVAVATDDDRIADAVKAFGGNVHKTSAAHTTGTSRCAEAAAGLDADIVVNIQGDEPFIQPAQIDLLVRHMRTSGCNIASLMKQITDEIDYHNPNVVKVVQAQNSFALYFSRAAIPFYREKSPQKKVHKHLGLYAYKSNVLQELVKLPPTPLEEAEMLEQLRWLEHGYSIGMAETEFEGIAIDTPEDLEKANKYLIERKL